MPCRLQHPLLQIDRRGPHELPQPIQRQEVGNVQKIQRGSDLPADQRSAPAAWRAGADRSVAATMRRSEPMEPPSLSMAHGYRSQGMARPRCVKSWEYLRARTHEPNGVAPGASRYPSKIFLPGFRLLDSFATPSELINSWIAWSTRDCDRQPPENLWNITTPQNTYSLHKI